jgi:hypothetical protein
MSAQANPIRYPPSGTYVDFRMDEWRMGEQPRRIQVSVRRVLSELSVESLMRLKDPKLQVVISPTTIHDTWAYFPIHRRRVISHHLTLRPQVRVLLLIGTDFTRQALRRATVVLTPEISRQSPGEMKETFEDRLRDCLGHVLLYLRSPKARNECADAWQEWKRSRTTSQRQIA